MTVWFPPSPEAQELASAKKRIAALESLLDDALNLARNYEAEFRALKAATGLPVQTLIGLAVERKHDGGW